MIETTHVAHDHKDVTREDLVAPGIETPDPSQFNAA
jgi:hypothetical protein